MGWESLGTDVRLIDMAEGLMRNHLKINLYSFLERRLDIFYMHLRVFLSVQISPVEGAGGLLQGGKGLYLSESNVTVFL